MTKRAINFMQPIKMAIYHKPNTFTSSLSGFIFRVAERGSRLQSWKYRPYAEEVYRGKFDFFEKNMMKIEIYTNIWA